MKLADLNPTLDGTAADGVLAFDCPVHPDRHRINIPIAQDDSGPWGARAWRSSGTFPDTLTLSPSILAHTAEPKDWDLTGEDWTNASACGWHGFIRNGEIIHA